MEEQTTWKGHTFTLLVFTGIVVLCSIFFILGMLVGHAQTQKGASVGTTAALKADAKPAPKEDKPDFTFYDSVKKEPPAVLQPAPAKPEPEPPSPEATKKVESAPQPKNVMSYQIAAFPKSSQAEKALDAVKKKGFKAFIMEPSSGEKNAYFRVLVGPFSDLIEAQDAKQKLEDAGYKKPILKK